MPEFPVFGAQARRLKIGMFVADALCVVRESDGNHISNLETKTKVRVPEFPDDALPHM